MEWFGGNHPPAIEKSQKFLNGNASGWPRSNIGERGIRTPGTVTRTHAFQACSLSHSDISPAAVSLQPSAISQGVRESLGFSVLLLTAYG